MALKKHRTVQNSKNMFTLTLNMQHLHQAHLPSYMMWKCWLWPSGHYRGRYLLQPLLWGSAGSPVETKGLNSTFWVSYMFSFPSVNNKNHTKPHRWKNSVWLEGEPPPPPQTLSDNGWPSTVTFSQTQIYNALQTKLNPFSLITFIFTVNFDIKAWKMFKVCYGLTQMEKEQRQWLTYGNYLVHIRIGPVQWTVHNNE